ncbi:ceramide-1-phosphate transfer protein-like [Zophobas morio]|uniref:ceramide-1-phosphate transfer protein-like n=1 Tax=Zophobas morio TaxID=2755281 RepID=UPI003082EF8A
MPKAPPSPSQQASFDIYKTLHEWNNIEEDIAHFKGEIKTELFIGAYRQLASFFSICGSGFTFVTSDITAKLKLIEKCNHERDAPNGNDTLQSMVTYEKQNGLLKNDKKNGSRNLLRLNRALQFIGFLIRGLLDSDRPTHLVALDAYNDSLAPFHSWAIRKTVGFAVYAIPSKDILLKRMEITEDEAFVSFPQLSDLLLKTYQTLYK